MGEDLLVFDLRNGRVGGLTFCRIVESWFRPDECFQIDNDTDIAVAQWRALPPDRRNEMRFVWGHRFSIFKTVVALDRRCKVVGLVRHPLLKISGVKTKTTGNFSVLEERSVLTEFEDYIKMGGILPSSNVMDFLDGHFMLGITEFMEESLFLLRAKLNLKAPIKEWRRIGADADQRDNIYSHGFLKDFIESNQYVRELDFYNYARDKFFHECHRLKIFQIKAYNTYKANCRDRDEILSKWTSAYPKIFSRGRSEGRPQVLAKRRGAANGQGRLAVKSPGSATPTLIHPGRQVWTVIVGDDEAELALGRGEDGPAGGQIDCSLFTLRIRFLSAVPTSPNMIRIDFDLPAMEQGRQSIYCSLKRHTLFDIDLGPEAGHRHFDIPISPAVTDVTFVFRQFGRSQAPEASMFAWVRKLAVLHIPLAGDAP